MTTGPNKPFKDLAWGLASLGAVVLRFDKVTHVHAAERFRRPGRQVPGRAECRRGHDSRR
jgi:hypothetical protein